MLQLRVYSPTNHTQAVTAVLADNPAVSVLSVDTGASIKPAGDVITADVAREAANAIIDELVAIGVHHDGTIALTPIPTWISQAGLDADQRAPGEESDAVVWAESAQEAYKSSTISWSYLSFMVLATLLASIAIILDSQILVIAAMVLGPEFGAVAAMGLALVRHRYALLRRAILALAVGFFVAIAVTSLVTLVGRALGWVTVIQVEAPRPDTQFIYTPDKWSFLVALIAGVAGVLALTSQRSGGLVGVFISVTTIPAAGNIALGIAFWLPAEIWGSTIQLLLNITGMAISGWATLEAQKIIFRCTFGNSGNATVELSGGEFRAIKTQFLN
ncbi:MAG: DUF389 domain-containing protein, partial [Actinomycetes bacterium]